MAWYFTYQVSFLLRYQFILKARGDMSCIIYLLKEHYKEDFKSRLQKQGTYIQRNTKSNTKTYPYTINIFYPLIPKN